MPPNIPKKVIMPPDNYDRIYTRGGNYAFIYTSLYQR